jgi:hypothetical protein
MARAQIRIKMGRSAAPAGVIDFGFVWFLVMQCRSIWAYIAEPEIRSV